MNIIEDLKWRGILKDVTNMDKFEEAVREKKPIYIGFDPTAKSLHIGSLLPLTILRRFKEAGHPTIAILGGATGMIGDPSGKKNERQLLTAEVIKENVEALSPQMKKIAQPTHILNNIDWIGNMTVVELLRDVGKNFNLKTMLNKDVVASRLEVGISFTEFAYQVIQGYDFYHLYKEMDCCLEGGGSDQWGNITAGTDLIRRMAGDDSKAAGITFNLVTKSDGTKFGKTEGGAVWLDENMSSPYEMYQYFWNADDGEAIKYMKYFTFLSREEIEAIEEEHAQSPFKRLAQKRLAAEVVKIVHGGEGLENALSTTDALFSGNINSIKPSDLKIALKGVPTAKVNNETLLIDAMIEVKAASSRREARQFINEGAVMLNGIKVSDAELTLLRDNAFDKQFFALRRGKRKWFVINL